MILECKRKVKMQSILCVSLLLATCAGVALLPDDDGMEESEAIAPLVIAGLMIISGLVGTASGIAIYHYLINDHEGDSDKEYVRQIETDVVAESINLGLIHYRNALENYENIWKLTDEHFVRVSEITTASLWDKDSEYDSLEVLSQAGVYSNSAYMLHNASAQISEHFHSLNERIALWNANETYNGKMQIDWVYGNQVFGSKTAVDGWIKPSASPTSGNDAVYIAGGDFWTFGGSAVLNGLEGQRITVPEGKCKLESIPGFVPDVYTLQQSRKYAGDIMEVLHPRGVDTIASVVMMADDSYRMATLHNGRIAIDGSHYNDLSIRITPDGGNPKQTSILSGLERYENLISATNKTVTKSHSAANTVWNIYNKAGSVSHYLTTLMVPNNYENVEINQAQQELITSLALIQLAEYVAAGRDKIEAGEYKFTPDSFSLFVRGRLLDSTGKVLHDNVIFTPFMYQNDASLRVGKNILTQTCIIPIWDSGKNLSAWDFTSSTKTAHQTVLTAGQSIEVFEILYGGDYVNSVELDVKAIDIIDPEKIPVVPIPDPPPQEEDWLGAVAMLLLVLGAVATVIGLAMRHKVIAFGGIAMLAIGGLIYIVREAVSNSIFGGLF